MIHTTMSGVAFKGNRYQHVTDTDNVINVNL